MFKLNLNFFCSLFKCPVAYLTILVFSSPDIFSKDIAIQGLRRIDLLVSQSNQIKSDTGHTERSGFESLESFLNFLDSVRTSKRLSVNNQRMTELDTVLDKELVMIDNHPISVQELKSLPAHSYTSVSVLRGEEAFQKFGSKGINGVILATTQKDNSEVQPSKSSYQALSEILRKSRRFQRGTRINSPSKLELNNQLIVLDGKKYTVAELKTMPPFRIENSWIKSRSDQLIEEYGPLAQNGVIIITTR